MKTITLYKTLFKLLLIAVAIFASGSLLAQSATITPANAVIAVNASQTFTVVTTGFGADNNNRSFSYTITGPGATIPATPTVFNCTSGCNNEGHAFQFPTPGVYNVAVTVQQTQGGSAVAATSTTITVVAAPPLAGGPTASANPCVDGGTAITSSTCPIGSFSASFQNGAVFLNAGSGGLAAGSIWRFTNVANIDGDQINATIKVDTLFRAVLAELDDDNAEDENGNQTLQTFFAPRIDPLGSLGSTSQNGYVQFTIEFWKNGWVDTAKLNGIRYSHFDIDGQYGNTRNNPSYYFRETGVVKNNFGSIVVTADANTELTPYNYSSNGNNWSGFAGTICNRSNFSRYAEVASTFNYPIQQSSVTIRMGYDYQKQAASGTYGDLAARLYASKFECFSFPEEIILPVKLLSFAGSFRNQMTTLNWETADEVNFEGFQVERSSDGSSFAPVATLAARGTTASSKQQYQHIDDLSAVNGTVFYYRLRMNDLDGKYKYSNVVMIRKEQKSINGITLNPNPVISGGMANVRFSAAGTANVEFRVVDMAGKVLLKQQSKVYEGNNSVSINNLDRLQPGMYMLQLANGNELTAVKFTIVR